MENLNLKSRTDEELGELANYLLQFDFDIIYRPGAANTAADCLSQNPVLESDHGDDTPDVLPTINLLELREIKECQPNITKHRSDKMVTRFMNGRRRILLDLSLGKKLIERTHIQFGHIGTKHIANILRRFYYFPRMYALSNIYCTHCVKCIKSKTRRKRDNSLLGQLGPARKPFEIMSLDTVVDSGVDSRRKSTCTYLSITSHDTLLF